MSLITIVIPTFNRTELLTKTIESALNQSYNQLEIIVVDDNSDVLISDFISKYISENKKEIFLIKTGGNKNGAYARNLGLRYSKGKHVCFIDDDDIIRQNFISEHYKVCTQNKYDMTACEHFRLINGRIYSATNLRSNYRNYSLHLLNGDLSIPTSTLFFKKSFIKSLGGFDEKFTRHQDLELLLRVFKSTNAIGLINQKLTLMNIDGHRNYPNGSQAERIKTQFYMKFSSIISSFNYEELKSINRYQYRGVACFYFRDKNFLRMVTICKKYIFGANPLNNILEIIKIVIMASYRLRVILSIILNLWYYDRD